MLRALFLALLVFAAPAAARSPKAVLADLLAADRAFAAASAKGEPLAGVMAMMDDEITVPIPGKGLIIGKPAVTEAYRACPCFKEGRVTWAPVRGGISADGTQGFTYGFLTASAGDPAKRDRKYIAYWVKRPAGWRVVAYRHIPREAGDVSTAMFAPALPRFTAKADAKRIAAHQASLAAAEKAFSDRAQVVGLKRAFGEYGRPDAMNMYAGAGFAYGLDAVVANFKDEGPAKVHWSTERSFVASSGDLGVSIGMIRPNTPPKAGEPEGFPFFTVWKRERPGAPWRYIAE
jgi:ketosteroid isomerase-like protein